MDNWYSSVGLAQTLYKRGLYCRGTLRSNRAHTPSAVLFTKADIKRYPRGTWRKAISRRLRLVVCSWLDGNVVTVLSNCDGSKGTQVKRKVGNQVVFQECPVIIPRYNKYMQGVDRHDQLRERFSTSSGHTFKKWYKKLAFALFDIAVTNAYVLWQKRDPQKRRDAHMHFQQILGMDLIRTNWSKCCAFMYITLSNISLTCLATQMTKPKKDSTPILLTWNAEHLKPVILSQVHHQVLLRL